MDQAQATALLARLDRLTVLAHVGEHPAARALRKLLKLLAGPKATQTKYVRAYAAVYRAWLDCLAQGHDGFAGALREAALFMPSPLATLCARLPYEQLPYSLLRAGAHDLAALGELAALQPAPMLDLAQRAGIPGEASSALPAWELFPPHQPADPRLEGFALNADGMKALSAFFRLHGTGLFASCPGLTWVGKSADFPLGLRGVSSPDPIQLEDLVLYEKQRQALIDNTRALLEGKPAANILLYGDKGTGKSATIKALLSRFWLEGLRIVEVPLAFLTQLPRVFALLRDQPGSFIVFVDDLAFSDSCPEYTALKTVLEGGLEARPSNTVVYATSNRRNIIRQRFSERQDDVNARDTLEEKFSLADRFDLRLTFEAPNQEEYLHIVAALCEARGIALDEKAQQEALAWTVARGGRSPRLARQFVEAKQREVGRDALGAP
ncbi:MAG: ATP-binding protein [Clostridia bacterium]|nr:ATP-binding protein [Clostridia bacterium]